MLNTDKNEMNNTIKRKVFTEPDTVLHIDLFYVRRPVIIDFI